MKAMINMEVQVHGNMMNKILIALVLAVGLSGNVLAYELNIYCDNDLNRGYTFNKSDGLTAMLIFHTPSDSIKEPHIRVTWSDDYVSWKGADGYFRINRKTVQLEYKKNTNGTYYFYGQCSLEDSIYDVKKLILKKQAEKTKGNKF